MVVVNLSGGCESVATLLWNLERKENVQVVHYEFGDSSRKETYRIHIICEEILGIPYKVIETNGFNQYFKTIADSTIWVPYSALYALQYEVEETHWGLNKTCPNLDRAELVYTAFDSIIKLGGGSSILRAPLQHKTKKEQYDSIPKEIKPYIAYCYRNRYHPCGKCAKCLEWNKEVWQM